jgi:hypothetical protein
MSTCLFHVNMFIRDSTSDPTNVCPILNIWKYQKKIYLSIIYFMLSLNPKNRDHIYYHIFLIQCSFVVGIASHPQLIIVLGWWSMTQCWPNRVPKFWFLVYSASVSILSGSVFGPRFICPPLMTLYDVEVLWWKYRSVIYKSHIVLLWL